MFPLVLHDERDPLSQHPGYESAVRALARDYLRLGSSLTYLKGDSEQLVVDAARDARADYVYVQARADTVGMDLLKAARAELELWGFGVLVFELPVKVNPPGTANALAAPASLSGHPLPGQPLPKAKPWGETELFELLKKAPASNALLQDALKLGLLSPRQCCVFNPQLIEALNQSAFLGVLDGAD